MQKIVSHKFSKDLPTNVIESFVECTSIGEHRVWIEVRPNSRLGSTSNVLLKKFLPRTGLGLAQTWHYKFTKMIEESYV